MHCRIWAALVAVLFVFHGPAKAETVSATGELVSPVRSELVARQAGRIGEVLVDEGDTVRRGQVLLRLETRYFELDAARAAAELARADAALAEAERELARKQELFARQSVAETVLDRAQAARDGAAAAHDAAQAAVDLARAHLADTELHAPFDGAVAERRVDVGEHLTISTAAFVLVRTAPLEVRFRLPERHLPKVAKGDVVRVFLEPFPGETFPGTVSRIGKVIDSETRSLLVEAELANADGRLLPGLFARVEIDLHGASD